MFLRSAHDRRVSDPEIAAHAVVADRLVLREPNRTDLPELFELYTDPRVWGPDPLTRHDSIEQTNRMVDNWRAAWRRDGLGMWTAYSADSTFVGIGGCFIRYGVAWNLGFRLRPRFWGQGYAQEISAAARTAARSLRADLPMTAYVLEGNERSRRAVERTGLRLAWRGADAGNPDASAIRLLYSDRQLSKETVNALTER
jgi:RimJ/RimL family protein N-acetyltransferase